MIVYNLFNLKNFDLRNIEILLIIINLIKLKK